MTLPSLPPRTPRPRDAIVDRLKQLHELRAEKRAQLVACLVTLDAIDQRIDAAVGELADCLRVPAPRRAGDVGADVGGGGEGVRT